MSDSTQMKYLIGENIEGDFCEAMRSIGGVRPTEINPKCAVDKNADIVFRDHGVIIEIKTLMHDSRAEKTFDERLAQLHKNWVKRKLVPPLYGQKFKFNTTILPKSCAHEFLRFATRPVKLRAEKANEQIKELKRTLNMPDAKGLLVLCNTGNPFLPPDTIGYGFHHALPRTRYKSIDWLIFMTRKLPVQLSVLPEQTDIFGGFVRDGYSPMPPDLFKKISEAWFNYMANKEKQPVKAYACENPEALFNVKYV